MLNVALYEYIVILQIAICCAVSGFTTLYGKVDPYLREIELHEHCFARGPEGCWAEAVQLYSKIGKAHIYIYIYIYIYIR